MYAWLDCSIDAMRRSVRWHLRALALYRSWLCGISGAVSRARGIFLRESLSKVAAAAASLDTKWPISVMLSMDTWIVSHSDF